MTAAFMSITAEIFYLKKINYDIQTKLTNIPCLFFKVK